MRSDDAFSRFIEGVYAAAIDPTVWPSVLEASADYVGGQAAGLMTKDSLRGTCTVHHQYGFDPNYLDRYQKEFWKLDPFPASSVFPLADAATVKDYLPHADFRRGRFYQEWGRPQGWLDAASFVLERAMTASSTFVIARHETSGVVDDEMNARMRLIGPHIRRARQISGQIDVRRAEQAAFADVLDGLSAGVFLVDAGLRIVHANTAGRTILAAGDLFSSSRSRLTGQDRGVDQALRRAVATIAEDREMNGEGAISLPVIANDDAHYVAHVLPVTTGSEFRSGIAGSAIAAVFVHRAAMDAKSLPEIVVRHYKLTPTELRVLLGIVEVGGAPEVADVLGIADNTVKTHLGRVYQKTGTRRQADLVKLVAGFATPLVA